MATVLIVISSKSPNPQLYGCIDSLYKIQINNNVNTYKICVIDSDSDDFTNYLQVTNHFPNVEVCYVKNKNYEYGAWKYALQLYPDYDIYFCIQDNVIIKDNINISIVDNTHAYTYNNNSGYNSDIWVKDLGIQLLQNSGLDYSSLIHTDFTLAQCSSFIVNNAVMKNIFFTLQEPPIDKSGSRCYERNFGLYFLLKYINTIDLLIYSNFTSGGRL